MPSPRLARMAASGATLLLAACASTQINSQWVDPQLAGTSLRGARVFVVCEAYDLGVRQVCQQQLVSEVVARGATAVPASEADAAQPRDGERYLDAARAADAQAVLAVSVSLADTRSSPGFTVGLGGFGIGGGSVRGGVGVSVPIGGHQLQSGYAASSRLTDTANGRLLWTAKATTAPSNDLNTQMSDLAKAVLGAAEKAGLF